MVRQRRRPRANHCHKINSWAEQIRILAMTMCVVSFPCHCGSPIHSSQKVLNSHLNDRPTDRSIDLIRNAKDHVRRHEYSRPFTHHLPNLICNFINRSSPRMTLLAEQESTKGLILNCVRSWLAMEIKYNCSPSLKSDTGEFHSLNINPPASRDLQTNHRVPRHHHQLNTDFNTTANAKNADISKEC